jgi:hypothetical protein
MTNKYEDPNLTLKELNSVIVVLEKVCKQCIDNKLHYLYHMAMLMGEMLRRRADYIQSIVDISEPPYAVRLTCPTSFLGAWLKYMVVTKNVAIGICDNRCERLFSNVDGGKCIDDAATTYPMGAPFRCGPMRAAPRVRCHNIWTDAYEMKYLYYASRNLCCDDKLKDTVLLVDVLSSLSCLLRIRYKTEIYYTPGVGNDSLDAARKTFYNDYEIYISNGWPRKG